MADADPTALPEDERAEIGARHVRVLEALVFASAEPIGTADVADFFDEGTDIEAVFERLQSAYQGRGIELVRRGDKWAFRTAEDLGYLLQREKTVSRPLSRAALETLAIIAYHQTVTRAEIEEIRGVSTGKGTLDLLMEAGWIRMRGRRRTPGRPVTYGTTEAFLDQFGLESLSDLPGMEELKGAGLLSNKLPADLQFPLPFDGMMRDDEDPLEPDDDGAEEDEDEPDSDENDGDMETDRVDGDRG